MNEHDARLERPSEPARSDDGAVNLAEPLEQIVAEADLIVRGDVVAVDVAVDSDGADDGAGEFGPQTASVAVDTVLKGDARVGELTIVKPRSAYRLEVGRSGVFVLQVTGDGAPTLFGYHGVHDARRFPEFERVLAGLPRLVPPPTDEEIRALAARADAIVVGPAVADGPVDFALGEHEYTAAARIDVQDVIAGDVPLGELPVLRRVSVFEVGARWGFPTDAPNPGVYFLDTSTVPAAVLNPIDPFQYQARAVRRALGL